VVAAGGLNRGVQELQSREEGLGDAYQRASIAKMEALARKKQIPPFIRKLNRYGPFTIVERMPDLTRVS
jgi:thiamine monophosphate synthase